MTTTYFTYKDPFPATVNHPNAIQIESTANWPKSFRHNSNRPPYQGFHPPAPVYNANQPAPQSWYYGPQQQPPQAGYYVNGQYYPAPAPPGTNYQFPSSPSSCYYYQPATKTSSPDWNTFLTQPTCPAYASGFYSQGYMGSSCYPGTKTYSYMEYLAPSGPTVVPMPACPATMTAQAAAAAATNATLAAMPQGPNHFVGNPTDYATQQAILAAQMAQMGMPKPPPTQLAPYKPADGQQFWCKELDGSWTLRTHTDIVMGEVSPGRWERHATSGYFFWVRALV